MNEYQVGLVFRQDMSDLGKLEKGQYVVAAESFSIVVNNTTVHINEGDWIVKTNEGLSVVVNED